MSTKEICDLPIKDLADENCALFMWATMPNLPDAFEVIKAWGFEYKTCAFVWVKTYKSGTPVVGLGYWTRSNAEICLLATKGKIRRAANDVSQIVMCGPGKHSEKPFVIRDKIVQLMGKLPRIELFARPTGLFIKDDFAGWDVWGNQIESDIKMEE